MKKNKKIKSRNHQTFSQHIGLRNIAVGMGIVLILTGIIGILHNLNFSEYWHVSDEGMLSYNLPQKADYSITEINKTESGHTLKSLVFTSRDNVIHALMRFPSSSEKVPGVVVLPGAGVTKEEQQAMVSAITDMGYASITIDQRNLGVVDPETDLSLFENGKEPVEYLMVYDALMAAEVLRDQKEVDPANIAMLGISNGGRFAIIATAIDPKIKGVVAISTSGYNTALINRSMVEENTYIFYRSIDPDTYIATISPRRVVMFHAFNDTIIPYSMAEKTFKLAMEPKAMYAINGSTHGYSNYTKEELEKELEIIFEQMN